jgi:hypothetical protein
MTQVTVSQAAELVARDRKTLYRLIKTGRLSATLDESGQRQIDTSELIRVFGALRQVGVAEGVSEPHDATGPETSQMATLQTELRHARELLAIKDEQIADLRQSVRLLGAPAVKKSWWRELF